MRLVRRLQEICHTVCFTHRITRQNHTVLIPTVPEMHHDTGSTRYSSAQAFVTIPVPEGIKAGRSRCKQQGLLQQRTCNSWGPGFSFIISQPINFRYIAMLRFSHVIRGPRGIFARRFTSMLGRKTLGMASNRDMSTAHICRLWLLYPQSFNCLCAEVSTHVCI